MTKNPDQNNSQVIPMIKTSAGVAVPLPGDSNGYIILSPTSGAGLIIKDMHDTDLPAVLAALNAFAAGGGESKNVTVKTLTFDGTAGHGQSPEAITLFTLSGTVRLKIYAICTTSLEDASAGTLSLGIIGKAEGFIVATAAADMDAGDIWHDATPDSDLELDSVYPTRVLTDGVTDGIYLSVAVDDIGSGAITFICFWTPVTTGATITAA